MSSSVGYLVVVVLVCSIANAVKVPWNNCDDGKTAIAKINELDFDCVGGTPVPCKFKKGVAVSGNVTFTPSKEVSNGKLSLRAIIGGAKFPFPMPDNDICEHHTLKCPLAAGKQQVMELSIEVPSFAPAVGLSAIIEVDNEAGDQVMCFVFLAQIVSGNSDIENDIVLT